MSREARVGRPSNLSQSLNLRGQKSHNEANGPILSKESLTLAAQCSSGICCLARGCVVRSTGLRQGGSCEAGGVKAGVVEATVSDAEDLCHESQCTGAGHAVEHEKFLSGKTTTLVAGGAAGCNGACTARTNARAIARIDARALCTISLRGAFR